ncbi:MULTISPECIES: gliding motility-associated ABC transporter permease subunit GldF [Cellulophaga]|uniref:Gliding motility-associated ABC transporter permease protein GldF n=2 Tax=Cellulophaga TaxID=104264 RepID=F0REK2_CELLC|nr:MULTISPECIES: gliding motility-associated ABC transporter permease subunit GldF [Cellulophaga]ADY31017.1 gliding motility-associated ABC transporter permease protein GldF [Cellulophaga lytica DSM 7489]AIM61982.1 ABC transporter permease [Cellulophaga lytica]APU11890.1 gliding motility-associated ABC transporter permease subunit GldF [Cellulophaga lytica]EWH13372.1 gliding motility-associated ABC transporter permease GldF [Cellulophaga geojensis KL-A]TVZ09661.1 ABC-2 type transport system pe
MYAIYKREIQSFFTSPIGYMVIGLFLIFCGLFLWVFKGEYNVFDYGFADLSNFFFLVPWVFLFLIPAITMKSFSEERKTGTLELLFIKPISLWQTVIGKFLGTLTLVIIAIIPTFLYVYSLSQLGQTIGNIDMGVVFGSYFGLLFLMASYTAIGIFASTLSQNQIVAFLLALILCFACFYGFQGISTLFTDGSTSVAIASLGMKAHFESIARGVIDTRDLIYFISLTVFFLFLTVVQLKNLNQ